MFQYSAALQTTPEKALDRARAVLRYAGLKVTQTGRDEISFIGPGRKDKRSFGSPLAVMTAGHFTVSAGRIEIEADLGMLRRHQIIGNLMMIVLIVVISVVLVITGEIKRQPDQAWGIVAMAGCWLFGVLPITMWTGYAFKSDIRRAMETIAAE